MIAGLLLAAGRSSRFGGDKLCAELNGQPVVRWSLRAVAHLDDVIVVAGPDDAALRKALAESHVRFVRNSQRDAGMSTSIVAGVEALAPDTNAVVIALGDQPFTSAEVTRALVQEWRRGNADIVVPAYRNGRGNPVLFGARCFAALRSLTGDHGARGLMSSGEFTIAEVRVDADIPVDVDTPGALALAARRATDEASISHPSA